MKRIAPFLLAVVLPSAAFSQIEVTARLAHSRVLQYEPVVVQLKIVNNTAAPLDVGSEGGNAILTFDVEQEPGVLAPATGAVRLDEPLLVGPQQEVVRNLDILSAYAIRRTGPYTITARVEWGGRLFLSSKMFLDVVPGLEISRLISQVPGEPSATRTYTLRTLNRDRMERLFLRIEDEDAAICYGVVDLGQIVRLYPPTVQVDGLGDVHILHQSAPSQYTHTILTPNGIVVARDLYTSDSSGVRMERTGDSQVTVRGAQPVFEAMADEAGGMESPGEDEDTPAAEESPVEAAVPEAEPAADADAPVGR